MSIDYELSMQIKTSQKSNPSITNVCFLSSNR